MKFLASIILFAAISTAYAAPAEPDAVEARSAFQANLRSALEPIKSEVRSMYGDAAAVAKDMANAVQESGSNVLHAGMKALTSEGLQGRSAIQTYKERMADIRDSIGENIQTLKQRMMDDVRPFAARERAMLGALTRAVDLAGNQYLTNDGKELVRALSNRIMTH